MSINWREVWLTRLHDVALAIVVSSFSAVITEVSNATMYGLQAYINFS